MTHPMCVLRVRKVSDSDLNNRGRVGVCLSDTSGIWICGARRSVRAS